MIYLLSKLFPNILHLITHDVNIKIMNPTRVKLMIKQINAAAFLDSQSDPTITK